MKVLVLDRTHKHTKIVKGKSSIPETAVKIQQLDNRQNKRTLFKIQSAERKWLC